MVLSSDDPLAHRKRCMLCSTPRDVLIRCQIDASGKWHLVCPGECWRGVSGGVDDGDAEHPHYRYGGAWKNRWADVTAKKPQRVKDRQKGERERKQKNSVSEETSLETHSWSAADGGVRYLIGNMVASDSRSWICVQGHRSKEGEEPATAPHLWKEAQQAIPLDQPMN